MTILLGRRSLRGAGNEQGNGHFTFNNQVTACLLLPTGGKTLPTTNGHLRKAASPLSSTVPRATPASSPRACGARQGGPSGGLTGPRPRVADPRLHTRLGRKELSLVNRLPCGGAARPPGPGAAPRGSRPWEAMRRPRGRNSGGTATSGRPTRDPALVRFLPALRHASPRLTAKLSICCVPTCFSHFCFK